MENLVNPQQLSQYYKNKKVFLTGHTGFKGAWLMSLLKVLGADIKGYALEPEYENGLFDLIKPLAFGKSIIADIRDKSRLLNELTSYHPDYIFHLAAQPLVRRSYEIPAETFEINVVGTANVLESATHLSGPCAIVVVTTDKVYENRRIEGFYTETDILGGYDPYSASKACTELVVNSFRQSFFNPDIQKGNKKAIASARAGNVIGGGDWNMDRIMPDVVRSLVKNQPVEVRNPGAIRPWQHVLEPLVGYLLLGSSLKENPQHYSKAYNFGPLPEDHLSVKQIVEMAINKWGKGSWKDISNRGQLHEAEILKLDISKAMNELNWRPKLNAAMAIDWTIEWYKQPVEKKVEYTIQQINHYLAL